MIKKERTFESSMKRLESIVTKLENGTEPLETSIKLFEEGTKIVEFCYGILDSAEQKIVKLTQRKEQIKETEDKENEI